MTCICFYKLLLTRENKNIWHPLYKYHRNNDYTNIIKVLEDYIEFNTEEVNTKSGERQSN